jgi:hypothetical protein
MRQAGRRIDEHGDEAGAQDGDEHDTEIQRQRLEHEHAVAGTKAEGAQACRGAADELVQFAEGQGARASPGFVDDGHLLSAGGGAGREQVGDVHRVLAKRVYSRSGWVVPRRMFNELLASCMRAWMTRR